MKYMRLSTLESALILRGLAFMRPKVSEDAQFDVELLQARVLDFYKQSKESESNVVSIEKAA